MPRRSKMRRLDVRLNGRLAGYYDYTPSGGVSFTYAEDWLSWEADHFAGRASEVASFWRV